MFFSIECRHENTGIRPPFAASARIDQSGEKLDGDAKQEVEEAAEVHHEYDQQDAAAAARDATADLGTEQLCPHDERVQAESQAARRRRKERVAVWVVPPKADRLLLCLIDRPDLDTHQTFPHLLLYDSETTGHHSPATGE